MGRPPSNGVPSFRFNAVEVAEMEAMLQAHQCTVPSREVLDALAQRFSLSAERSGKLEVSGKQVWNWFQNRRYALRAKAARSHPVQVNMPVVPQNDQSAIRNVSQASQHQTVYYQDHQHQTATTNTIRSTPPISHPTHAPLAKSAGSNASENSVMEFEVKSARDGAWYDVASFLSYRALESGEPEALVRFSGFGPEEDEWVNIIRHVRQRSLPCESSECVAVLPKDLILCFQEGKEQALYFDAHVLDAQRRRHDVRGCRCRFLVRYDHDQSEEIVPLRKICRRPETDYRLQQLHGMLTNVDAQKPGMDAKSRSAVKVDASGMVKKHEGYGDTGFMTKVPIHATKVESALPSPVSATVTVTISGQLPSSTTAAAIVTTFRDSALPSTANAAANVTTPSDSASPSTGTAAANVTAVTPTFSVKISAESALPFASNTSSTASPSTGSVVASATNATSSVPPAGGPALPPLAVATSIVPLSGESALPSVTPATSRVTSSGESTQPSATISTTNAAPSGESALPATASTPAAPSGESALPAPAGPSGESALLATASTTATPSGESALPATASTIAAPSPSGASLLPAAASASGESALPPVASTIAAPSGESSSPAAASAYAAPAGVSALHAAAASTIAAPAGESALQAAASAIAAPSGESALQVDASTIASHSGAWPDAASTNAAPSGEFSLVAAANIRSNIASVPPPAAETASLTNTSESVIPVAAAPVADGTTAVESTMTSSIGPDTGMDMEIDVGISN